MNQLSLHQERCAAFWRANEPAVASAAKINWASNTSVTVSEVYERYRIAKQNHRSRREIERIFERYILPVIGTVAIALVDRSTVTVLIDDIAFFGCRPAPVMARAVAAQLSAFFSWSIARLNFLDDNPCRLAGRPPRPQPRSRILTKEEVAVLWSVLDQEQAPWKDAIQLILLTGQRRSEVFDADREEFDLERALWTIPARRSKNGREHQVPLSEHAAALIKRIADGSGHKLFPARGRPERGASGFSKAMRRINFAVLSQTGGSITFTLQDLRRTVATGLQRLGVKLEVTEAVLNHVSGSRAGIVGVYQLYAFEDEKRSALGLWAEELASIVEAAPAALRSRCR